MESQREKKVAHIDFAPAEVYSQYVPEVEVVGDVSGALWELNQRLGPETPSDLQTQLTEAITSQELCVVEVPVDTSVNGQLDEQLNAYWTNQS